MFATADSGPCAAPSKPDWSRYIEMGSYSRVLTVNHAPELEFCTVFRGGGGCWLGGAARHYITPDGVNDPEKAIVVVHISYWA